MTSRAYLWPGGQPAVDGYLEMTCPWCRHELKVRVSYAGHRVRCSYCRQVFGVPNADGSAAEHAEGQSGSGEINLATVSAEPPAPAFTPPDGFAIPGYEILGIIGDGSMGRVYKARASRFGRQVVAIKVLRDALARDPEYLRRFRGEAEIAARLSHENVVHFLEAGEVDGRPYIVMEFAEGKTVQDQLDRGVPFDERTATQIVLAVAEALDHARRRGLVHRDVKPSNVLLAPSGGVKLLDLGLARPIADEEWANAEAGNPIGTPEYISPEQVRGRVDVDIRSDIYALGATLYHMVTGRVPYSGTTVEVLRQHIDRSLSPPSPRQINPKLSAGLEAVIVKMLSKDREQRYTNADELILDLRRVLMGERPHALTENSPNARFFFDDPE